MELPGGFKERMKKILGEEYAAFEESLLAERSYGLRVNTLKAPGGEASLAAHIAKGTGLPLKKIPWTRDGYYYPASGRPGRHPFHEAGLYYIQEPSAMAPAGLLDARPGERILDLCAAPGGKAGQIAAALGGEGLLVANEVDGKRARILSQTMERLGVRNALVTNETPKRLKAAFGAYFDRVLVDAPCSGEGMFKKEEAALSQWRPSLAAECSVRQREILEEAQAMLKPGGRLVYSTCTFSPEENEGVIRAFLKAHPNFSLAEVALIPGFSGGLLTWPGKEGGEEAGLHLERCVRLWPHKARGEGHFMAVLEKNAGIVESRKPEKKAAGKRTVGVQREKKEERALFRSFLEDTFTEMPVPSGWESLVCFGAELYCRPQPGLPLAGLRVLRAGLHLGTFKKNRFEPAHALALAVKASKVRLRLEVCEDGYGPAYKYLRGETLGAEEGKLSGGASGWVLVCMDGFGLGWGKATGGIVKNHYPKGLRLF